MNDNDHCIHSVVSDRLDTAGMKGYAGSKQWGQVVSCTTPLLPQCRDLLDQCSKLRFKCMHPPGAYSGKCVHPEFKSSAHKLRYTRHIREDGAYAGCIRRVHSF